MLVLCFFLNAIIIFHFPCHIVVAFNKKHKNLRILMSYIYYF